MAEISKLLRKNLPPKSHLEAIGAIAALWAILESNMELMILGLYEINADRGLVLTSNLSFNSRLDLLRILATNDAANDAVLTERFVTVVNRIENMYGDRNKMVHALWRRLEGQPGIARRITLRARGKRVRGAVEDFTASAIWAVFDKIADVQQELASLTTAMGVEGKMRAATPHSSKTSRT